MYLDLNLGTYFRYWGYRLPGLLWEEFLRQLVWDDCSIVYLGYQHLYDYKDIS